MISTLLLIAFAVLAISVLLISVRGHSQAKSLEDLMTHAKKIDLAAFRNLTDAAEEHYLRTHLESREFRIAQRRRMRAAIDYVWRVACNAALLMQIGQTARHQHDPDTATAGAELAHRALQLRIYCLLALGKLCLHIAMPDARLSVSTVADRYEKLRDSVLNLGWLLAPAQLSKLRDCL